MSELLARRVEEAKSLAVHTSRGLRDLQSEVRGQRAQPAPQATLIRAAASRFLAHINSERPEDTAARLYPDQPAVLRAISNTPAFLRRAVANPALTTVPSWAQELVQPANQGAVRSLAPASAYAQLAQRGLRVEIGAHGSIRLPHRASPPAPGSPFQGEGDPIRVRKFSLSSQTLKPHRAAFISLYSREIAKWSVPSIEAVLRAGLAEDVAAGVDGVLLSDSAATAIQPAGLLNNVAALTPADGVAADLGALAAAIPNAADLVFIMSSAQALAAAAINPGGLSLIVADTVPGGTVIAVDASDFATATGDDPQILVTEEAAIVADDGDPVPAWGQSQTRSLYQEDLLAIRLSESLGWATRRPGRVAFVEVQW
jgi:hypothetical protein